MRNRGVFKKIVLFIGCIFCISFFCSTNFFKIPNANAQEGVSFLEFEKQICSVIQDDDYSGVEIDENVTFNGLIDALGVESEYEVSTYSYETDSGILSYDEIDEVCSAFGYDVIESDDGYVAHNLFELKRLIVNGELTNSYGASKVISGYEDYNILCYNTEEETEYAYNQLVKDENLKVRIDLVVTATDLNSSLNQDLNNSYSATSHYTWGAEAMNVDNFISYLNLSGSSREVVVAVLDTGLYTDHELFSGRLLYSGGNIVGYSYYNGTDSLINADSDYNGGASTPSYFQDGDGHGTHVSGTICDLTPSNVKILPIKVLDDEGSGAILASHLACIRVDKVYAQQYNIAAINMSLGTDASKYSTSKISGWNETIDEILEGLLSKNILTVVAAGNRGTSYANYSQGWPAGCNNAITVTNLYEAVFSYEIFYSSSYGTAVDICAPGTYIKSAHPYRYDEDNDTFDKSVKIPNNYANLTGTSMAAPHVAAAVALYCLDSQYWSGNTASYEADVIRQRLYDDAVYVDSDTTKYGNGMVYLAVPTPVLPDIPYTASDRSYTYDGSYHNIGIYVESGITYTIKYKNPTMSDYCSTIYDYRFNGTTRDVCGTRVMIMFVISADGYNDTYGYAYLTIGPRPVTIKIDDKESYYGGDIVELTASLSSGSFAYGESVSNLNMSYSTTATSSSNIGSYNITGSANNSNYSVTVIDGTYTIKPRPVTVTISNASSVYGNAIDISGVSATASLVNGDTISSLSLTYNITGVSRTSNVGTYTDVIGATYSNSNYIVTFSKGDYVITPRAVTINTYQTSVYGNSISTNTTYTIDSGSVLSGDNLGVTYTTSGLTNKSSVGKYYSALSFSYTNTNYQVTKGEFVYEITKRPITIMISNRECEYGEEVADDDSLYTITQGSVVSGDNLAIDLTVNLTSNIPGYYVISGTCGNTNYDVTYVNGILQIKAREIKISIYQKSYYGEEIVIDHLDYDTVSGTLINSTDNLDIIFKTGATSSSPVGTYAIEVDSCNPYYDVIVSSGIYEICIKELRVEIDNKTSCYGDSIVEFSYKIYDETEQANESDLLNFDIDIICSATNETNVSQVPITGQNNQADKYDIEFVNGTYTITKRDITITLNDLESQYGDALKVLTYQISSGSLASKDNKEDLNINITTTATSRSSVNTYPITATYSNGNYNITFENGVYTITKRKVSISTEQTGMFGTPISLDNTKFDVVSGSVLSGDNLGLTFTTTATSASTPGEYPITMIYTNTNYDITLVSGIFKQYGKLVKITISNVSSVYGEELTLSGVVCEVEDADVTLADLNLQLSCLALTQKTVGTYDINAESGNYNYAIDYVPGKYEITKRPVVINVSQSGVYGNTPVLNNTDFDIVSGSIVNSDNLSLTFATSATNTSIVDDYNITISACGNPNYNVTIQTGTYTINQRDITIKINSCSSVYGEPINYADVVYSITSDNQVVNGDDLNLVFVCEDLTPNTYGNYDSKSYVLTAECKNANYNATMVNGAYYITRRQISIDIDDYVREYGDEFKAEDVTYSITEGSIANGESVDNLNLSFTMSRYVTSNSAVGTYADRVGGSYSGGNYYVIFKKAACVIEPRELVIETSQSAEYGQTPTLNNNSYTVVGGSVVDGDRLGLSFATDAVRGSSPGTYNITLTSYTNTNYNITLRSGIFTISNKRLVIIVNDASSIYGEDISTITYGLKTGYSLMAGDNLADLNVQTSTIATNISPVNEEGYPISAEYDNVNYDVTFELGVYKILSKPIKVVVNNTTSVYGESLSSLTCQLDESSSLVDDDTIDDLNITLSCSVTSGSGVLESGYSITASYENLNYTITFTSAKYMVTPREIHIVTQQSGQYGQTPILSNDFTVVGGSIINADELGITFVTDATNISPMGQYEISISGYTNKNYDIVLDEGKYIVVPANITIVLNDSSSVYGDEISSLTYILKDGFALAPNDTLNDLNIIVSTTATSTSVVNEIGYLISAAADNENYVVTFENATYTILPKVIEVEINDVTGVYLEQIKPLTCALHNSYALVGSDSFEDLNIQLYTSATNNSDVKVGGYPITAVYNNHNYNIRFNNGVYTITPLQVNININDQSGVYGNVVSLNNDLYDIVGADVITKEMLNVTLKTDATHTSSVGEYSIKLKSNSDNFQINATNGTLDINKRKVSIKLNNQDAKRFFEFELSDSDYSVTDGSVCNEDDLQLSLKTDASWYSWMGQYDLSAISNNPNYDVIIEDGFVEVKVSTTDIVAVVLISALILFTVVKVTITLVRKNKKQKENIKVYNDWINRY